VKENGFAYRILDNELSWEAQQMRDSVRAWVEGRVMPGFTRYYMDGRFPMERVPEMGHMGFFGIKTSSEYGGSGLGSYEYGVICRELEAGDSGLRSFVSVQNSLVMFPIERFGSEEQKRHWLPLLATGSAIGAFGLTGPEGGSDPEQMKTHAKKDGGDYVINGSKQFITNGSVAHITIIWAKLDGVVRGFLVQKGTSGFEVRAMKDKLSLRASDTAELFLQDVRIPAENILPGTLEHSRSYLACLNEARFGIAWGAIGAARYCAEMALKYVQDRTLFGGTLAGKQLVQQKLEAMDEMIEAAQHRALYIAKRKEAGELTAREISRAKKANVHMACEVARMARRMLGANGIMAEYGVMRHMCNLESVYTYEGTDDVHMLAIGRAITGKNAF